MAELIAKLKSEFGAKSVTAGLTESVSLARLAVEIVSLEGVAEAK